MLLFSPGIDAGDDDDGDGGDNNAAAADDDDGDDEVLPDVTEVDDICGVASAVHSKLQLPMTHVLGIVLMATNTCRTMMWKHIV